MNLVEKMAMHYQGQYGDETASLFAALGRSLEKLALINPFIKKSSVASLIDGKAHETIGNVEFCRMPTVAPLMVDGLLSHYFLDMSSVFAPLLLPIECGMNVLDMCSAPGGKLLVMVSRMIKDVEFTANDASKTRSVRLKKVIQDFLPNAQRASIRITNKDANLFGLRAKSSFDAILLDAPCSSEAHIVQDPTLLSQFSGLRKTLPTRQYSLLSAALLALKPGGHVMYATCSINRHENQGVIERLLKKKGDTCSVVPLNAPLGKKDDLGISILPHLHGAGPAFLSLIRKNPA